MGSPVIDPVESVTRTRPDPARRLRQSAVGRSDPATAQRYRCRIGCGRIERQLAKARGGGFAFSAPKSAAGKRTVYFPATIAAELRWHLDQFPNPAAAALVFTSTRGKPIRHSHFRQRVWRPAAADALGMMGVHVHDLRHAGSSLSAAAGASLRELMDRMGHASTRAALIYPHGSDERQRKIASNLDALARQELAESNRKRQGRSPRGTSVARNS